MARLLLVMIALTAPAAVPAGATPQQPAYGPVVTSYLTGLTEELNELNFQLRHREISRGDYDRALQRLSVLRRAVERVAAEQREDFVPEIQVLAADELSLLGLGRRPEAGELRAGEVLDGRWKVISVERGTPRFYVFERLPLPAPAVVSPGEAIETVVVPEAAPPERPAPPPAERPSPSRPAVPAMSRPRSVRADPEPAPGAISGPRIYSFYLPTYSSDAQKRGVEGDLIVSALFQRNGKIKNVKVEEGLGHGLDGRAAEAVKRTAFEPAQLGGEPVDVRVQLIFTFKQNKVTVRLETAARAAQEE
jgi:TonB family protein